MAADELRLVWREETAEGGTRRQRVDRLLRHILSPLVGIAPPQLAFGREPKGRPFLRHDGAPDFNLSDTAGGTLVAICRQGRVGVDLERVDRAPPVQRLARRWFDAAEADALAAMSAEAARIAFLRLWTAKEASCKATGTGIFGYLQQWHFEAASETPRLRAPPADAGAASRWQFLRLAPGSEHTAVVALRDARPVTVSAYCLVD